MDSKYILSGSEDMNIRIWKSQASAPVGIVRKNSYFNLKWEYNVTLNLSFFLVFTIFFPIKIISKSLIYHFCDIFLIGY